MTKEEFEAMLTAVLASGVTLNVFMRDGVVVYDMNTGMKSHLHVSWVEGVCTVEGRYGHEAVITNLEDLVCEVQQCRQGREYYNASWSALLTRFE